MMREDVDEEGNFNFKAPADESNDEEDQEAEAFANVTAKKKGDLWQNKKKEAKLLELNMTKTEEHYICNNVGCKYR
jgi:hypothetical protein